ncbi:alpha-(1,3)-fucosyltransferase C-like [Mizuhopecten yessoensis]|nr:alpha-(1,3)-fucosyltransferase C-like [Mizuhopecten yessoensis]
MTTALFMLIISTITMIQNQVMPRYRVNTVPPSFRVKSKPETILVQYYNKPKFINLQSFVGCEYKCEMKAGSVNYASAKAVIFHGPTIQKTPPPPTKPRGQIWIMQGFESPIYYINDLLQWNNLFNWTFTYRRDSDITRTQSVFHVNPKNITLSNIVKKWKAKDRMSAWMVSHCGAHSKRDRYAKRLQNSIDIHVYGECGTYRCDRSHKNYCFKLLQEHYKYYLAFENSLCVDYVTEKGFKTYVHSPSTIPVMRGGLNYSLFFPPGSYLNTKNFKTVDKLGIAINNSNQSKESMFSWKKTYYASSGTMHSSWCLLCKRLHLSNHYQRLYSNIHNWLYDKPRSACKVPTDL